MAWRRLSRSLGLAAMLLFLACAFTPLPNFLAAHLAPSARLEPADAIVVLGGGGIRGDGTLSNLSLRRTLHGVRLQRRGLASLLALSGSPAAAEARRSLARDLGVPPELILVEPGARTTGEEALRLGAALRSREVRRILLVTDSQDLPRAGALFEQEGFEVLPAPTDSVSASAARPEGRLELTRQILRELVGRLYYRLSGSL